MMDYNICKKKLQQNCIESQKKVLYIRETARLLTLNNRFQFNYNYMNTLRTG